MLARRVMPDNLAESTRRRRQPLIVIVVGSMQARTKSCVLTFAPSKVDALYTKTGITDKTGSWVIGDIYSLTRDSAIVRSRRLRHTSVGESYGGESSCMSHWPIMRPAGLKVTEIEIRSSCLVPNRSSHRRENKTCTTQLPADL